MLCLQNATSSASGIKYKVHPRLRIPWCFVNLYWSLLHICNSIVRWDAIGLCAMCHMCRQRGARGGLGGSCRKGPGIQMFCFFHRGLPSAVTCQGDSAVVWSLYSTFFAVFWVETQLPGLVLRHEQKVCHALLILDLAALLQQTQDWLMTGGLWISLSSCHQEVHKIVRGCGWRGTISSPQDILQASVNSLSLFTIQIF